MFLYTPSAKSGPGYKFALPHKGPYQVLEIYDNVACIQPIGQPSTDRLRVAIERLWHCLKECLPDKEPTETNPTEDDTTPAGTSSLPEAAEHDQPNPWRDRLRRRNQTQGEGMTGTSLEDDREM